MKRLDLLLEQYEKEREAAKTLVELQQAARNLVEAIDALPDNTQIELWIRTMFVGLSGLARGRQKAWY